MLVSIIVPTRNRPHLLAQALQAISSQTYSKLELILVDDGSSPENALANRKLLQNINLHAKNYLFLDCSNNLGSGPSFVRNAGIAQSKGDLVAFCDDDDFWSRATHIEDSVNAFQLDNDLDFIFANQVAVQNGTVTRQVWMPDLVNKLGIGKSETSTFVAKRDCLIVPGEFAHLNTCVVRRDLVDRIGCLWEGVRYSEDMDFFVRAVDKSKKILYKNHSVSVHNVPNRALTVNASTQLSEINKLLALVYIAEHLLETCEGETSIKYARRIGADACRKLTWIAKKREVLSAAIVWAKLALAWNFTAKFYAFLLYLRARYWFSKIV